MSGLNRLYRPSLALLTDLYQLTMACAYWKSDLGDRLSVFHLFFRRNPFGGGFTVTAGLEAVVAFLEQFQYQTDDLDYLSGLNGNDQKPLFPEEFLRELESISLEVDIDAMPEGTIAFPNEPLIRVTGPLLQCQLLETPLLNLVNFPTLIATKSARMNLAAAGDPVLEFGLRRAQGIDGGVTASRAAFLGGCYATSNVLAGKLFGIPVKGTHAHSWVMAFDSELEAFKKYAQAMPANCIFLVDTYDTLGGVENALNVGKWLRSQGHEMIGVRLDSGDFRELSRRTRQLLDSGGFSKAVVVATGDLDEYKIHRLKKDGAPIEVWGVGTQLATGAPAASLGGVYKLAAVKGLDGEWRYRLKLSEEVAKSTDPGEIQVRRFFDHDCFWGDVLFDRSLIQDPCCTAIHRGQGGKQVRVPPELDSEDLLIPVYRSGARVMDLPPLVDLQAKVLRQLDQLPGSVRQFKDPSTYFVGLEKSLYDLKRRLVQEAREKGNRNQVKPAMSVKHETN